MDEEALRIKKSILMYHKTKDDKDYKKLHRCYQKLQAGEIDKKVLLILIKEDETVVRLWSASFMLRLKFKIRKAKKVLADIANTKDSGDARFDAEWTLKVFEEQGYL